MTTLVQVMEDTLGKLRELEDSHVELEGKHEDLKNRFETLAVSHSHLLTTVGPNTCPGLQGETIWSGLSSLTNKTTEGFTHTSWMTWKLAVLSTSKRNSPAQPPLQEQESPNLER